MDIFEYKIMPAKYFKDDGERLNHIKS